LRWFKPNYNKGNDNKKKWIKSKEKLMVDLKNYKVSVRTDKKKRKNKRE